MSLTAEYPLWLALICLLLAAAGSWFLYGWNKPRVQGRYEKPALIALIVLRFLGIFLVAFLLLGPLLTMISRKVEKPFIVIAVDNSESVVSGKDSAFYRNELPAMLSKLGDALGSDYEVKSYTFGKEMKAGNALTFIEKQTDISNVFNEIGNAYSNQNLGAVILASDGIYNEGSNPIYSSRELKVPVFAIALGDTNRHKDLLIKNVRHNQLVYQGNMFPVQVDVSAFGCSNQPAVLSIEHKGQKVFAKNITPDAQQFFTTVPVELQATENGTQHYIITLSRLTGEASYVNNRYDFFVNVISGKQKILVLALAPHPDLSAYKQAIETNENYQVDLKFSDRADVQDLRLYDLVILHQLPGMRGEGVNIIRQLKDKKVPVLYVLGSLTGINVLNSLETRISISGNRQNNNDAQASFNPSFSLFTLSDQELAAIKKFPPLIAPYGNYKINGESDVLFKQQVGYVTTDLPLVFFSRQQGERTGFICGEGFWKWRLYDANLSQQQTTGSLVGKMVQFLAVKADNRLLRVTGKRKFDENEKLLFDAELYNESYELINSPDVLMKITDPKGKSFDYTFSKTEKAYMLDAGILPVGTYTYEASASIGNRKEHVKGTFTIMPIQVEYLQTVADHQLLNELAKNNGGRSFTPAQTDALVKAVKENENIKPVIYQQEEVKSWINLKWIFFIVFGLMSVEWFIRKWNGTV